MVILTIIMILTKRRERKEKPKKNKHQTVLTILTMLPILKIAHYTRSSDQPLLASSSVFIYWACLCMGWDIPVPSLDQLSQAFCLPETHRSHSVTAGMSVYLHYSHLKSKATAPATKKKMSPIPAKNRTYNKVQLEANH